MARAVGIENTTPLNFKELEGMLGNAKALQRNNRECKGIFIGPFSRSLGPDNRGTLLARLNIAVIQEKTEHFSDAEKLFKDVLYIQTRTLGRDHPDTTLSFYDLADLYYLEKRYAGAILFYRQVLEIQRRILGRGHPQTLDTLYGLACVLNLNGERESAFRTLRELVDAGFSDAHRLGTDDDLKLLRNDPRFAVLVTEVQKHARADQKSH